MQKNENERFYILDDVSGPVTLKFSHPSFILKVRGGLVGAAMALHHKFCGALILAQHDNFQ